MKSAHSSTGGNKHRRCASTPLIVSALLALTLVLACDTAASAQAAAKGDIFESGACVGKVLNPFGIPFTSGSNFIRPGMIPVMVPGDIFALGTDEYKSKNISPMFNDDPRDPFYYGIPSASDEIFVGYRNATVQELLDATMGRPKLTKATTAANVGKRWIWKNNAIAEPRWALGRMPLRVYISGTAQKAQGGRLVQAIEAALREWAAASNGVLHYEITDKYVLADIDFAESPDKPTDIDDAINFAETSVRIDINRRCEGELAATDVRYHKGEIDQARVYFDQKCCKLPWRSLKGLCLRQVGHAFGIEDNSANAGDAMSYMSCSCEKPVFALSARDKSALAALYERVAVPENWPQNGALAVSSASTYQKY